MSKNAEAIICFILFFHQFFDRSYGSYMIQSSDFDKIKFEIQNLNKNCYFHQRYKFKKKNVSIIPMGALRYKAKFLAKQ